MLTYKNCCSVDKDYSDGSRDMFIHMHSNGWAYYGFPPIKTCVCRIAVVGLASFHPVFAQSKTVTAGSLQCRVGDVLTAIH